MKMQDENSKTVWQEILNPWTMAATLVVIAGIAVSVWLIANLWSLLVLAVLCIGSAYIYRRVKSRIQVADGVTVTPGALKGYLLGIIRDQEGVVNPDLIIKGSGDGLTIKLVMDFPTDPEEAADFHSKVIYLQGYISRRLYDDFRISGTKVEIEAARRARLSKTADVL